MQERPRFRFRADLSSYLSYLSPSRQDAEQRCAAGRGALRSTADLSAPELGRRHRRRQRAQALNLFCKGSQPDVQIGDKFVSRPGTCRILSARRGRFHGRGCNVAIFQGCVYRNLALHPNPVFIIHSLLRDTRLCADSGISFAHNGNNLLIGGGVNWHRWVG